MGPVELSGAHSDPWKVRREVVPAVLSWNEARLGLLVEQMQPLMARIEADEPRLVHGMTAHPLEEVERIGDAVDDSLVGIPKRRVLHEPQVPILRVVQVGEASIDQRANEIQRQCRPLVAAQQQLRVGRARCRGELGTVYEVSAIGRQRDPLTHLTVRGAWLRVLTCHATDTHDRLLETVQQHETHLQQDLQLLGDLIGFAIGKCLRAVSSLKEKSLSALGCRQALAQRLDFPRHDDGREPREVRDDPVQGFLIRVTGLLVGRLALPAGAVPGGVLRGTHPMGCYHR